MRDKRLAERIAAQKRQREAAKMQSQLEAQSKAADAAVAQVQAEQAAQAPETPAPAQVASGPSTQDPKASSVRPTNTPDSSSSATSSSSSSSSTSPTKPKEAPKAPAATQPAPDTTPAPATETKTVEPYVIPEEYKNVPQDFTSPALGSWNTKYAQEDESTPSDEHRTVLQSLMGWDDVPVGKRWNHFIEHGFTGMHGERLNELMRLANAENSSGLGSSSSYSKARLANERHRSAIKSQWDKLLQEWNTGRYASGDSLTVQAFFKEAERLRQAYANAGFDPNELRNPSLNAGGFQQGFQKDLQTLRGKSEHLGTWLKNIQEHTAKDPNWLARHGQPSFDKLSEYVILNMAESKGQIADAEKIRAQVESMYYADRAVYDKFMKSLFNANFIAQVESMANAGNRHALAYTEDMAKFLNLANQGHGAYGKIENGKLILSPEATHIINGALETVRVLFQQADNNPISIDSAITSYKNAADMFDNYVMKNANVDRKMIWDLAVDQYNEYRDRYNSTLPKLGLLWGWQDPGVKVDPGFSDYLDRWQAAQPVNDVIASASVGIGHPPKPTEDPRTDRSGGGSFAKNTAPPGVPANATFNEKKNRWEWQQGGHWRYADAQ